MSSLFFFYAAACSSSFMLLLVLLLLCCCLLFFFYAAACFSSFMLLLTLLLLHCCLSFTSPKLVATDHTDYISESHSQIFSSRLFFHRINMYSSLLDKSDMSSSSSRMSF